VGKRIAGELALLSDERQGATCSQRGNDQKRKEVERRRDPAMRPRRDFIFHFKKTPTFPRNGETYLGGDAQTSKSRDFARRGGGAKKDHYSARCTGVVWEPNKKEEGPRSSLEMQGPVR